jgi:YVTN family beta-propeller protein
MKPKIVINLCGLAGFAGLLMAAPSLRAQNYRLYVDNSTDKTVSVVDLDSLKVISNIDLGADLIHGLALKPDGKLLFVTVESDHTLRIVDTTTGQTKATIKLTGRPNECAVTPDGKYVAVPIRDGDSVNIVDVAQQKVVKVLPIKEPHNAVSTASNRYMYVSSMGSNAVNVVDLKTMSFSSIVPAGGRPRPYVISSDGKTMYVAVSFLHGFDIVDIPGKKVLQRVEMPARRSGPPRPRKFETPDTLTHGLALTPDGKELWVTSLLDDSIYIYDLETKKFSGPLATGDGPNWIVFSPDGKYGCVSNTDSNDVSIFDVKERRELARVKVGKVPKRLVIGTDPKAPPQRSAHL